MYEKLNEVILSKYKSSLERECEITKIDDENYVNDKLKIAEEDLNSGESDSIKIAIRGGIDAEDIIKILGEEHRSLVEEKIKNLNVIEISDEEDIFSGECNCKDNHDE